MLRSVPRQCISSCESVMHLSAAATFLKDYPGQYTLTSPISMGICWPAIHILLGRDSKAGFANNVVALGTSSFDWAKTSRDSSPFKWLLCTHQTYFVSHSWVHFLRLLHTDSSDDFDMAIQEILAALLSLVSCCLSLIFSKCLRRHRSQMLTWPCDAGFYCVVLWDNAIDVCYGRWMPSSRFT